MLTRFKTVLFFLLALTFSAHSQNNYVSVTMHGKSNVNAFNYHYQQYLMRRIADVVLEGRLTPRSGNYDQMPSMSMAELEEKISYYGEDDWGDWGFSDYTPTLYDVPDSLELVYQINDKGKLGQLTALSLSKYEWGIDPIILVKPEELKEIELRNFVHPLNEADNMNLLDAIEQKRYALGSYRFHTGDNSFVSAERHPTFKALADSLKSARLKEPPVSSQVKEYYRKYLAMVTYHPNNDYNIPLFTKGQEFVQLLIDKTKEGIIIPYKEPSVVMTKEEFLSNIEYERFDEDFGGFEDDWGWGEEANPEVVGETHTPIDPNDMLIRVSYDVEEKGDQINKRMTWLDIMVSAEATSTGIMMPVAKYKINDVEELLKQSPYYWHHPLNYNDSTDFLSAIKNDRVRSGEVYVTDSRYRHVFIDILLKGEENYKPRGNEPGYWYVDNDNLLKDADEDFIRQNQKFLDLFVGAHWNDSTALPPKAWNTDQEGLIKFRSVRSFFAEVGATGVHDSTFKEVLYQDVLNGTLKSYLMLNQDLSPIPTDSISDAITTSELDENERETWRVLEARELSMLWFEDEFTYENEFFNSKPDIIAYGISAYDNPAGFHWPKVYFKFDEFYNYLSKRKNKAVKKVYKIFKKGQYGYFVERITDFYGREVLQVEDEDDVPYYYRTIFEGKDL